jgi:hypothetical protein
VTIQARAWKPCADAIGVCWASVAWQRRYGSAPPHTMERACGCGEKPVRKRFPVMKADRRLTFESCCLGLATEQLLCGDEVVARTPKAFTVPRRLVEDGGQLVRKEELLRAGWAMTHVSNHIFFPLDLRLDRESDTVPQNCTSRHHTAWRGRL